eukprot:12913000-Alexandrium_andersonii.AAC.1
MQDPPRVARRLLHLAVRVVGLRCSPFPSRGEGRLARWACWEPPRAGFGTFAFAFASSRWRGLRE